MDDMWIRRCLERRGVEKYFIPASNRMGIALSVAWHHDAARFD